MIQSSFVRCSFPFHLECFKIEISQFSYFIYSVYWHLKAFKYIQHKQICDGVDVLLMHEHGN